jgi:Family of unknown function (DUF5996)
MWPSLSYDQWHATCDTLHAHTQVLGKLAANLAPPEPQLQHAALRLTARGWETAPLPAPNGDGVVVVALNLGDHAALIEHSDGRVHEVPLTPDRPVGDVAREILAAVGPVTIDMTPQEVTWTVPLDQDQEHATYDVEHVTTYFAMATRAARVLTEYRAPFRGRSTPVNAWWGSFDLSVSLFSGEPATPPSDSFIMRNAMDAQEVAVGWWPGDAGHDQAAFYAYAHPGNEALAGTDHWNATLGEFVLDWDEVADSADPHATALKFARDKFRDACLACRWDRKLAASADGTPPPVR